MGERRLPPLSHREAVLLRHAATLAGMVRMPGRIPYELLIHVTEIIFDADRARSDRVVKNLIRDGYLSRRPKTDIVNILRRSHPKGREPVGEPAEEIQRATLHSMADEWLAVNAPSG